MKFLHTGDLHIGKAVNDISMIEEQRGFLERIADIAVEERTDAVIAAGDLYDRAIPSTAAVTLLDSFLSRLAQEKIPALLISGNHDSPERVGFAGGILRRNGIYLAGPWEGRAKEILFTDEFGEISFVLLPFVRAAAVDARSNGEAVDKMLRAGREVITHGRGAAGRGGRNGESAAGGEAGRRSVLVTHYFVTDSGREPELSDSETAIHVGGLDNVEASAFDGFDYTALGHIHKAQQIGGRPVYYAGAPLKYSFSEANQMKSVNLVELREKGNLTVTKRRIEPQHDMRRIRGRLEELMRPEVTGAADRYDYMQATLTNEEELIDPAGTLRSVYPNLMQIVFDKGRESMTERELTKLVNSPAAEKMTPLDLFRDFFREVRGAEPGEETAGIAAELLKKAEGGAEEE